MTNHVKTQANHLNSQPNISHWNFWSPRSSRRSQNLSSSLRVDNVWTVLAKYWANVIWPQLYFLALECSIRSAKWIPFAAKVVSSSQTKHSCPLVNSFLSKSSSVSGEQDSCPLFYAQFQIPPVPGNIFYQANGAKLFPYFSHLHHERDTSASSSRAQFILLACQPWDFKDQTSEPLFG